MLRNLALITAITGLAGFISAGQLLAQDVVVIEPAMPAVQLPAAYGPAGPVDGNAEDFIKAQAAARQSFQERLDQHLDAYLDWVAVVCGLTDPQRQAATARARDVGGSSPAANYAHQMTGSQPPFAAAFAHATGVATLVRLHLTEELRQTVLTPDQSAKLDGALRERTALRRRAYRDFAIAILDRELYFTAEQRDLAANLISENSSRFDGPSPQSSVSGEDCKAYELPETLRTQLSAEQTLAWISCFQKPGEFRSVIMPDGQIDEIKRLGREGRDALMKAAELQIAYYQQAARLSPPQVEALRLAAKRIAVQRVDQWEAERTPKEPEEAQAGFVPGQFEIMLIHDGLGPHFSSDFNAASRAALLRADPNWQEALRQALAEAPREGVTERDRFFRNARATAVVAMLDEELWLREGQRPLMRELIAGSLPESADAFLQSWNSGYQSLCAAAIGAGNGTAPAFLNEPQKAVWQQLEKHKPQEVGMQFPIFFNGLMNHGGVMIEERAVILPQFAPAAEPAVEIHPHEMAIPGVNVPQPDEGAVSPFPLEIPAR